MHTFLNVKKDGSTASISQFYRLIMLYFVILIATSVTVFALEKSISTENKLNAEKRKTIVKKVSEVLNEYYIFPEVAKNVEKLLKEKLKSGEYDNIRSLKVFTYQLTKDLQSVSKDLHLRVYPYQGGNSGESELDPEVLYQQRLAKWQKKNFGFRKVEILDGNIGYVDFRGFFDARAAGTTAIAAMNFLAYCDALIIDLRENGGGQPSMSQLICSYFFDEPKHLNSFYRRKGEITEQFWTHAHVHGPRLADTPIYVLVSKETFSAAEGFAYTLKHMERATIIGEKTRGGAHPQKPHDFPKESITVDVPYGRAINPITKTNWEGKGITPNILIRSDKALEIAHIEALKKLLTMEKDEKVKHGLSMIIEEVEAKLNPVILDEETLLSYTGNYERGMKAILEKGSLNIMGYILIPMGNDKFMIKNGEEQVQFVKDDSGNISKLVVIFRNGRRIPFKRLND